MLKLFTYYYLLGRIFPFEWVTNINPVQRDVDELAFQPWWPGVGLKWLGVAFREKNPGYVIDDKENSICQLSGHVVLTRLR